MFAGSKVLPLVYLPSWMNMAGYVAGMATGFLLHHLQNAGVKLNQAKVTNLFLPTTADVTYWWEYSPTTQEIAGSIPTQC
jgi:hypothetical protein